MIMVNQLQDLADILYRAADDGNVDPHKVEQILGVPQASTKMERVAEEISGRFYILFTLYTDSLLFNCRFLPSMLVWNVKLLSCVRRQQVTVVTASHVDLWKRSG